MLIPVALISSLSVVFWGLRDASSLALDVVRVTTDESLVCVLSGSWNDESVASRNDSWRSREESRNGASSAIEGMLASVPEAVNVTVGWRRVSVAWFVITEEDTEGEEGGREGEEGGMEGGRGERDGGRGGREGGREGEGGKGGIFYLMHCVHFLVILPSSSNLQVTGCAKVWKLCSPSLVYTHIVQLQNAPGSCGKWTPFIRKVSLFGRILTAFPSKPSECADSSLLSYKYI